ncbi:hypothetical protein HY384_03660 [Candidatus Daviesbacteria bacterium]|nr:hypothetical protein [Candidatus Daviesbacteria bacterium]
MKTREFEHLTTQDLYFLDKAINEQEITQGDIPRGISIAFDSLGTLRSPLTDRLYAGVSKALRSFRDTLKQHQLTLAVATNGPNIEGLDILKAVNPIHDQVAAYAVTEGGGILISRARNNQGWDYTTLVDESCISHLPTIATEASGRSPLMKVLLEDTEQKAEQPPIRTPYRTNIVLTLPKDYAILMRRLLAAGLNPADIPDIIPGATADNYVAKFLTYAQAQFSEVIMGSGLDKLIAPPLVKVANRRIYVTPKMTVDGSDLSKFGGVILGSRFLSSEFEGEYQPYDMANSIYVADNILEATPDGHQVGSGERSMVLGFGSFWGRLPAGVRAFNTYNAGYTKEGEMFILTDLAPRLAFNIRNKDLPITDAVVEKVRVLHIGSGGKALEAIAYLYEKLYN